MRHPYDREHDVPQLGLWAVGFAVVWVLILVTAGALYRSPSPRPRTAAWCYAEATLVEIGDRHEWMAIVWGELVVLPDEDTWWPCSALRLEGKA
jgi:hypothetical protein